jgi:hypothetical protein
LHHLQIQTERPLLLPKRNNPSVILPRAAVMDGLTLAANVLYATSMGIFRQKWLKNRMDIAQMDENNCRL